MLLVDAFVDLQASVESESTSEGSEESLDEVDEETIIKYYFQLPAASWL